MENNFITPLSGILIIGGAVVAIAGFLGNPTLFAFNGTLHTNWIQVMIGALIIALGTFIRYSK